MRLSSSIPCGLAFVMLSAAAPVLAHHGFAVEFDPKNPITLAGEVTKMEFMNPHIYLYLNVKGKDGKVVWKNRVPGAIGEIFERHGFIWGAKWYHFDTMHFEYRPELIALAKQGWPRK